MPDAFHEVVYRAVADFSNVVREAARVRAELAAINADINKLNASAARLGNTNVGGGGSASPASAANLVGDTQRQNQALHTQGNEIDRNRQLLDKHVAALRANGQEFETLRGKYTQMGFDGLGQKALKNLNDVAGKMRDTVRQHQEELGRITEGRGFTFADKPGKLTQPGLISPAQARGEREIIGATQKLNEQSQALDRNSEAAQRNIATNQDLAESVRSLSVEFSHARDVTEPGRNIGGADTEREPAESRSVSRRAEARETEAQRNRRLSNTQSRSTQRRRDLQSAEVAAEEARNQRLSNTQVRSTQRKLDTTFTGSVEEDARNTRLSQTQSRSLQRRLDAAAVARTEQENLAEQRTNNTKINDLRKRTAIERAALEQKTSAEVAKIEQRTEDDRLKAEVDTANRRLDGVNKRTIIRKTSAARIAGIEAATEAQIAADAAKLRDINLRGQIDRRTQRGVGSARVEEANERVRSQRLEGLDSRRITRRVGEQKVGALQDRRADSAQAALEKRTADERERIRRSDERASQSEVKFIGDETERRLRAEAAAEVAREAGDEKIRNLRLKNSDARVALRKRSVTSQAALDLRNALAQSTAEELARIRIEKADDVARQDKLARTSKRKEAREKAAELLDIVSEVGFQKIETARARTVSARNIRDTTAVRKTTTQQVGASQIQAASDRAGVAASTRDAADERLTQSLLRTAALIERNEVSERLRDIQLERAAIGLEKARGGSGRPKTIGASFRQLRARAAPFAERFLNPKDVEDDLSLLGRVRHAFAEVHKEREAAGTAGGAGGILGTAGGVLSQFGGNIASSLAGGAAKLITIRGLIVAAIASLGPLIAAFGALGAAAIGLGNGLISVVGSLAALPGILAAAGAGIAALIVGFKPLASVFTAYQAAQKASNKASDQSKQALTDEKRAQDALNDARKEALRNLEDLAIAVGRAGLDEEGARLNLREAQAAYRKELADPNSTLLSREEALHRVKVAEADLADVLLKNKRNVEDLAEAQAKGVDGSKSVLSAIDALKTAQGNAKAGSSAAATAQAELKRQLDLLSPSARKVADALLTQADAFKKVQANVSERLFAPIVGQLGSLPKLLTVVNTLLTDAAGAIGEVAAKGLALISSGPFTADFATISKNNVGLIRSFGDGVLSIISAFRNLAIAAAPFTQFLADSFKNIARNFDDFTKKGRDSGSIGRFLDTTQTRLEQIGSIVSNLFKLFSSLFFASADFTNDFFGSFVEMTKRWAEFGKEAENPNSKFRTWLRDVKPLLHDVAGFIGAVARAFAQIASDPRNINEAKDILTKLSKDVLPNLVRFFGELSRSQTVSDIVGAFGALLDAVNTFLEAGGTTALQAFFGSMEVFFRDFVKPLLENKIVVSIVAGLAIALSALAAASVISKFSGLLLIARAIGFIAGNKGKVGAAILEALFGIKTAAATAAGGTAVAGSKAGDLLENQKVVGTYTTQLDVIIALLRKIAFAQGVEDVENIGLGAGGAKGKAGAAKGAVKVGEEVAEDAVKVAEKSGLVKFFSFLAKALGITAVAGAGSSVVSKLFGGGSKVTMAGVDDSVLNAPTTPRPKGRLPRLFSNLTPEERAAEIAAAQARTAGGTAVKAGEATAAKTAGKFALGGRVAGGLADPFAIPGLIIGSLADAGYLGKKGSATKQVGQAAGAALTGAAIGGTIGTIVPGIGNVVGAIVGALVGLAYSLFKDAGLRKRLTDGLGTFFTTVGQNLVLPVVQFFAKIRDNVAGFASRGLESFKESALYNALIRPIVAILVGTANGLFKLGLRSNSLAVQYFLKPLTSTFIAIKGAVEGVTKGALRTIANDFLRPVLAVFFGIKHAVEGLTKSVLKAATESLRPFVVVFFGVKHAVEGLTKAVIKTVVDGLIRPLVILFFGVKSAVEGLGVAILESLLNSVIRPLVSVFFSVKHRVESTATSLFEAAYGVVTGLIQTIQNGVKKYVINPILDGLLAVLKFALQFPTFVERVAEQIPIIGPEIKKAYDNLGSSISGPAKRLQSGGLVDGHYDGRPDTVNSWLTAGEWVTRKRVVDKPMAKQLLGDLNNERLDPAQFYAALSGLTVTSIPSSSLKHTVLSPQAMTVSTVNNNGRGGLQVGDITINNPIRERTDRSLRRTLQTAAYLHDR